MANTQKTVIVTGGSRGIGAGLVKAFLDRGYQVVANSRNITKSGAFEASDELALFDGSIAEAATAAKIAEVVKSKFGSIDALVNNAGIYFSKHFTDYTVDDLRSLISVNIRRPFLALRCKLTRHQQEQALKLLDQAEPQSAVARLLDCDQSTIQAGGALGGVVVHPCLRHFADFIGRSLGLT
jgi:NAD(P)-dependent dehydrogenase (short-subunit alcohol dehydrogenase family)